MFVAFSEVSGQHRFDIWDELMNAFNNLFHVLLQGPDGGRAKNATQVSACHDIASSGPARLLNPPAARAGIGYQVWRWR
jgi:hypothetical protein